ncbi:MAG TPA: OsmC family peroxiredoxin [Acidimicrobiales bacterium]|nr:OsmC family peroxiredoxin [Acidimicrobiales bacterium]
MSTFRRARTIWKGPYQGGSATVSLTSSGLGPFAEAPATAEIAPSGQTSPMELLAAAEASCVCGTIAYLLEKAGHAPEQLDGTADVELDGATVRSVRVHIVGAVPGLTSEQFAAVAERAKANCPVSKALSGTAISIAAELVPGASRTLPRQSAEISALGHGGSSRSPGLGTAPPAAGD